LDVAKKDRTIENAVHLIDVYEQYLISNSRKSILHAIQEVKIVDEGGSLDF
jgi:uncharacterized protein YnzC (UPF0291/DUF896 family)